MDMMQPYPGMAAALWKGWKGVPMKSETWFMRFWRRYLRQLTVQQGLLLSTCLAIICERAIANLLRLLTSVLRAVT